MSKITKDVLKEIVERWNSGESLDYIAEKVGLSKVYVRSLISQMRKAGVPVVRRRRRGNIKRVIEELVVEYKQAV